MKKLNKKGFTLIELLAVIVILAIIVVVTVPTIINTIADARVNSIWNLAVATANSYDTMSAQDMLASDKVLDGITVTSNWSCISDDLAEILDLSGTDVVLADELGDGFTTDATTGAVTLTEANISGETCSAIRLKSNGSAEVLLVANAGGKFDVSGSTVYALSYNDNGVSME